jgi:thiamine pyrophosphokinase
MSKNDITGDNIKSKINSKQFEDGYDRIFRNKSKTNQSVECATCFCDDRGCQKQRQKAIAQNGNVGYDLDSIYQQVNNDYKED